MYQHNYWKLKKIFNIVMKVVLWVFGICLLAINFIYKLINYENSETKIIDYNVISSIVSTLSIIIAFIWREFERKWWKNMRIQKLLPERFKTPVIGGRWKGTLIRNNKEHPFILEITQTFTSISCSTYSQHSHSKSIFAEILYDSCRNTYQLLYYWNGSTENTGDITMESVNFNGVTILDVNIFRNELSGSYFTNRQPKQTHGKLYFSSRQNECKNSFDD